jgi:hypothetical protein
VITCSSSDLDVGCPWRLGLAISASSSRPFGHPSGVPLVRHAQINPLGALRILLLAELVTAHNGGYSRACQ